MIRSNLEVTLKPDEALILGVLGKLGGKFKAMVSKSLFRIDAPGRQRLLSSTELEMLGQLANGWSIDEISVDHGLSKMTVSVYFRTISAKLGTKNITQAVAVSVSAGLVELD